MTPIRISLLTLLVLFLATLFDSSPGQALVKVPPGNRNAKQPEIPYGAVSRTRSTNGSFEGKYEKIRDLLQSDRKLVAKIKKVSAEYDIAPIHMIGALVGEHTYNVDALDRLQTYYVKALAYFKTDITFAHDSEKVTKFVARPEFASCSSAKDSYELWACRETIWNSKFRGQTRGGKTWPNYYFNHVFFQPFYAGQTFGLGQINPLTALRVTDLVSRTSGKKKLSADRAPQVYKEIIDPDSTLRYMAAIIRTSIDAYREIAGFDISQNPGITATLYNLGDVRNRARKLKARNTGGSTVLPQENYYGWLINEKLDGA